MADRIDRQVVARIIFSRWENYFESYVNYPHNLPETLEYIMVVALMRSVEDFHRNEYSEDPQALSARLHRPVFYLSQGDYLVLGWQVGYWKYKINSTIEERRILDYYHNCYITALSFAAITLKQRLQPLNPNLKIRDFDPLAVVSESSLDAIESREHKTIRLPVGGVMGRFQLDKDKKTSIPIKSKAKVEAKYTKL